MNKIKKEIYNLAREYAKEYLTGNLGKVVEEEDKLICYVKKNKLKKDYLGYTIICTDIREFNSKLVTAYKLDKPIVYVIDGLEFKKDYVNIYGYNGCEVIVKDCNFNRGAAIKVAGKCLIEQTTIKNPIYKWLHLYADDLTLKNMKIDNYLHLAGCDLSISLSSKKNLTIIDSVIGKLNERTKVSMYAEEKMVINNSRIVGNHINCESPRIATYQDSEFVANDGINIKTNSFNPIKVTAPVINLNGEEINHKDKTITLKKITDSLSLKRIELIKLLKQLSNKCTEITEDKISRYSEEVKNHTIKKILTK